MNLLGTFTYTYDAQSNRLATVAYPNGQTSTYSYLPVSQDLRLQTIHHKYPNGATLSRFDYTYDAMGNILTWRQQADSTAVSWAYGYDAADQLTQAVKWNTAQPPAVLQRYAYTYDPAGNRTSEQIDDAITMATYDALNRLVTQTPGGSLRFSGTVSEPATVTIQGRPAVVDPTNLFHGTAPVASGTNVATVVAVDLSGNQATQQYQLTQSGSTKTFTYDANGNLTFDGTRTFSWDARNELVSTEMAAHRSDFSYDGSRHRVRLVETDSGSTQSDLQMMWCNNEICESRSAVGGNMIRYFSQGEEHGADASHFYATDHLGSATEVTSTFGEIESRYGFAPWGQRTLVSGTDTTAIGFTGNYIHQPSAMYLTMYRIQDPFTGRWLSEDPAGLVAGTDLYQYVSNRPVELVDSTGLVAYLRCEYIGRQASGINYKIPFRHCYIDVDCNGRRILEMWGPGEGGRPGYGHPKSPPPSDTRNSHATQTEIAGWSASCQECAFEKKLIDCFEKLKESIPPYTASGPNSNTFAQSIISCAGGQVKFPWNAVGAK